MCLCVCVCVCERERERVREILAVGCYTRMHLRLFAEKCWAVCRLRTAKSHKVKPGTNNKKVELFLDNGSLLEKLTALF